MIYLAGLIRPSTSSLLVIRFPAELGSFDFNNLNECFRANDFIIKEFGAQFLPMEYAAAMNDQAAESFSEVFYKSYEGKLPPCDLNSFDFEE